MWACDLSSSIYIARIVSGGGKKQHIKATNECQAGTKITSSASCSNARSSLC